jgi:hypothetical protein
MFRNYKKNKINFHVFNFLKRLKENTIKKFRYLFDLNFFYL